MGTQLFGDGVIHFKFIGKIDASDAYKELLINDTLFRPHTPKPEQSPPLREGMSIHLRIHDYNSKSGEVSAEMTAKEFADKMLVAVDSPYMRVFPECQKLIQQTLNMIPSGVLGRAYIAKMVAGGTIYPHIDPGKYFELHDRYHIVVKTNPGVSFTCGDDVIETVRFEENEVWVFNNKVIHQAVNQGSEDRIHIIMDVRHDEPQYVSK